MLKNKDLQSIIKLCEDHVHDETVDNGIFTGNAGLALFYFEKYKIYKDDISLSKFEEYLEVSLDSLNKSDFFSLCSGNIGVYFLIFHLCKNEYFEEGIEDSFDEFPEYAYELTDFYAVNKNFDYLHGFLGVLHLCLELYAFSKDFSFKKRLENPIIHSINLLKSFAVDLDDNKIAWISKGYYSKVEGFSFGFAHGIPSIMSILTRALHMGFETDTINTLLSKSYNYIISIKGNYNGASFPNFITVAGDEHIFGETSRIAWCYGDLSVGVALLNYAHVIKDSSIVKEATEILLKTLNRDYESTGVIDVFLCHGSSGLIMIYYNLFKKTGISKFYEYAVFWMEDTIAKIKKDEHGLKTWLGKDGWIDQDTILEGKTGLLLQLYSVNEENYSSPLENLFLLNYEN